MISSAETPRGPSWVLGRGLAHLRRRPFGLVVVAGLSEPSATRVARSLGLEPLVLEAVDPWPAIQASGAAGDRCAERLVWLHLPDAPPEGFFSAFNRGRETLREAELRLVVSTSERGLAALAERASDVWSYRDRVVWLPDFDPAASTHVGEDGLDGAPRVLSEKVEHELVEAEWPWLDPSVRMERLLDASLSLSELGRHEEALAVIERAEQLRPAIELEDIRSGANVDLGDMPPGAVVDLMFEGRALPTWRSAGQSEKVVAYLEARSSPPASRPGEGTSTPASSSLERLTALADLASARADFQRAIETREDKIRASRALPWAQAYTVGSGPTLVNIADDYISLGDVPQAEDALSRARGEIERSGDDWRWMVASAVHQHEAALARLRLDLETVLREEAAAERCQEKLGATTKRDGARARRAEDLREMGAEAAAWEFLSATPHLLPEWAAGLGDYAADAVGDWLLEAERRAEASLASPDRYREAFLLETWARVTEAAAAVFEDATRAAAALELFEQAIAAAEAAEQPDQAARLRWAKGRTRARENPEAGASDFRAARQFAEGRWGPSLRAQLEWEEARGWRRHGSLDRAEAHLDAASAALGSAPPRYRPRPATKDLALELAELRVAQGRAQDALTTLEGARREVSRPGLDRLVLDVDLALAELESAPPHRRLAAQRAALRAAERGQLANAIARSLAVQAELQPEQARELLAEAEQLAAPLARGPARAGVDRARRGLGAVAEAD